MVAAETASWLRTSGERPVGIAATAVAAATLLIPVLGPPSAAGTAQQDAARTFAASAQTLPDAMSLGTLPVTAGVLVSTRGIPIAGATVVLSVEPANERLAAMRVSDSYQPRFVSRAVTSADGSWALRLPPSTDLKASIAKSGDINFTVMAMGSGWAAAAVVGRSVTAATSQASVSRSAGAAAWLVDDAAALRVRLAAHPALPPTAKVDSALACTTSLTADYGSTLSTVGEGFSDAASVTTSFYYGTGQSSSLGVAVSYGSGFSASGTASVSKGSGAGFPTFSGAVNRAFRTNFDYRRYYPLCNTSPSYSTVKPVSFSGGAANYAISDVAMGRCVGYAAGSRFDKYSSTATTISGGVGISGHIGINLSAKTGYSTSAKLTYFMNGTGHPVCGKDDYPGNTPGLVQVHTATWNP